jgi:hypothetical protein
MANRRSIQRGDVRSDAQKGDNTFIQLKILARNKADLVVSLT